MRSNVWSKRRKQQKGRNKMNTETRTTAQTRPQGNAMLSPNRPPHAGKKKPNPALLRLLRMAMLIAGGLILLFGLLLLVLPMFRVQGIEVSGNSFYSTFITNNLFWIDFWQKTLLTFFIHFFSLFLLLTT